MLRLLNAAQLAFSGRGNRKQIKINLKLLSYVNFLVGYLTIIIMRVGE